VLNLNQGITIKRQPVAKAANNLWGLVHPNLDRLGAVRTLFLTSPFIRTTHPIVNDQPG